MKLTKALDRLASYETGAMPVVSVYLDTSGSENGREDFLTWLRGESSAAAEELNEETRAAYDASMLRINEFLENDRDPAANGIAVFAGLDDDSLFETIQIDEPFPNNRFFVFERPHIFPLARVISQNPRYAVLWADTNKARIWIFGGEDTVESAPDAKVEEISNEAPVNRTKVGGWSQARYQRHVENFHLKHAKETVDELEKLMRDRDIQHLILCGDEATIMPILRPQLSKETEATVVGVVSMSQYASEDDVREKTSELMATQKALLDKENAERVFDAAKAAAGLGTIGVEKTLEALSNGQVEELIISSVFDNIRYNTKVVDKVLDAYAPGDDNSGSDHIPEASEKRQITDELIIRALNSSAKITFIGDESLLTDAGGVGAVLRYNMNATANG
jgi:peptide chain release factor subunit 1